MKARYHRLQNPKNQLQLMFAQHHFIGVLSQRFVYVTKSMGLERLLD